MATNLEQLIEAGLIVKDPVPQPYLDVIESLSEDDVRTIVDLMQNPVIVKLTQNLEEASVEPPWYDVMMPPF